MKRISRSLSCFLTSLAATAAANPAADEFTRCVDPTAELRKLGGDMKFTEGPVWVPRDDGSL
jgi:hypothetical protein